MCVFAHRHCTVLPFKGTSEVAAVLNASTLPQLGRCCIVVQNNHIREVDLITKNMMVIGDLMPYQPE